MSSISESSDGDKHGIHVNCGCGADVKQYTSKTQENPGRPFFGCSTMKKGHLFKWVEDAVLEEVEDMSSKIHMIEVLRSKVDAIDIEVQKLKTQVDVTEELVYEMHKNGLEGSRELKMIRMICILSMLVSVLSVLIAKNVF